jgi:hypothetical protein
MMARVDRIQQQEPTMRTLSLAAAAIALSIPSVPAMAQHHGHHDRGHHGRGHRVQHRHHDGGRGHWHHDNYNHLRHGEGHYYPEHYYHSRGYRPIRVTRHTRIYRGYNGRYYCRRSDGTTGLIVGAALGGVLGNAVSDGRSSLLATVLGAGAGGLLGRSIDRGNVTCR